ncbi:hypothetical protein GHT06_010729 [Daphnia sinensis]|uniref:Uncharacterized protein n=1 Tax=Daphnia sinensis TaxID=1820382 RepID=A0AAD5KYX2_9CRUS|nr:hypothetical protein GHT06_010729 [Daphnia sinensis]
MKRFAALVIYVVLFICVLYSSNVELRLEFILGAVVLRTCVLSDSFFWWWTYIRISPFHAAVNRIPGPKFYLPMLGNSLDAIITSQKVINKGASYKALLPWLGQGLLVSSGDLWRSRRKLMTPAFHFYALKNYFKIFNEQSRILSRIIGEMYKSYPETKGEIDVYPYLARCSLDIIFEATAGTTINAQTQDSDSARAAYRIVQVVVEKQLQPWLENPWLFSLSTLGREHNQLLKTLHGFTKDVIRKRRKSLREEKRNMAEKTEPGIRSALPLLDLLLKASDDGEVLSDRDIRNEIDTFMFEEQAWVEVNDIFTDSERDCTQEDISNLKYLECCIKETLRIYPSGPVFERDVQEDIQIGKYSIPAGCTLGFLALAMHRNPKVFPDPLVFKPERFFPDEAIGRHPYAYIPFSAGPRNCIGQRFAMLEGKVVLSTLLRHFKFEISSSKPPIPSYQVTLKSLNGIHLIVSRR